MIYPDIGNPFFKHIQLEPLENGVFNAGEAKIQLNAPTLAPMLLGDPQSGVDQVEIRFTYITAQGETKGSIKETWNIKNNSNTKVGEVLDGLAVFVFDDKSELNHIGKTLYYVTDDRKRYFDFVQELLNQVVPRKRSVRDYTLLEEDGSYGDNTLIAIFDLKEKFNIKNTEDAKCDFKKLMADYNQTDYAAWENRIVDKRTLAGDTLRVDGQVLDDRINGNGGADTGLYELYVNVIKQFAAAMIELEEYYAGEKGTAGVDAPTLNWYARTTEGPPGSAKLHGSGMSYCYGCKNDIEQFNANVANCASPARSASAQYNLYYIVQGAVTRTGNMELVDPNAANTVPANYHANVQEIACTLTGDKKYPGIYAHEQTSWNYGGGGYFRNQNAGNGQLTNPWPAFPQFNPDHWAGTDCSGLAQRGVHNGRTAVQGIVDIAIPVAGAPWIRARNFFENNDYVYFLPIPTGNSAAETQARNKILKQVKKSDLLGNGNPVGHITTVYTERATLVGDQVRYKIIHANGSPEYTYPAYDPTRPNLKVFSRKVIISWQNIVSNPVSFGRIKIWN